jgi:CLIP-associating protein 1/2
MLRGQAYEQFPEAFVAGLKHGFFEGLSKTVSLFTCRSHADTQIVSLRTTVSQQSCALMQELAEALGSSFDPFVENVLPILAKMS